MKLPKEVIVTREKLLRYLLLPREKNDKSKFLAFAGYTLANGEVLLEDLRQFIQKYEISSSESTPFGIKYEVRGTLIGPNGRTLALMTVWIKLEATRETRFVTLFPDKEVTD